MIVKWKCNGSEVARNSHRTKDMIFYDKNDIVSPPIAAGHRGQYIFTDL